MTDRISDEGREPPHNAELAKRFGELVRTRRAELKLNQADVAFATGIGRRFIIELEAGKPTCHLGKALVIAEAVGIKIVDLMARGERGDAGAAHHIDTNTAAADDIDLPDVQP